MALIFCAVFLVAFVSAQLPGRSTRYWDCCKPSCSWDDKADVIRPVATCSADGYIVLGIGQTSGCDGGPAFTCNNNQPWAVNDQLAYGFVAVNIAGQTEYTWCCACYEMTFTSGPVVGKRMIVQVTNTGADLGYNHFDIQMPGGGVGYFNGCTPQWNAPPDGWGARYGGVSSLQECDQLPHQIRDGCIWRFTWFLGADNPDFTFVRTTCPLELTQRSQCIRNQP